MNRIFAHVRWLLARTSGKPWQRALNVIAIFFVSMLIPWVIGYRFVTPFILIPLACLSVFLVADLAVITFSRSEQGDSVSKAIACILLGWSFGLTILLLGILGLNWLNWDARWLLPQAEIFADALGLSLSAGVLTAGLVWQAMERLTPTMVRIGLKMAIVLVMLLCVYGCNRWQIEGTFLLTTRVITWISIFAAAGMLAAGGGLLLLPSEPMRPVSPEEPSGPQSDR